MGRNRGKGEKETEGREREGRGRKRGKGEKEREGGERENGEK